MSGYNFKKYCICLSEDLFTITNIVDPDEKQHYAALNLGLHCLKKYSFRGLPTTTGVYLLYCFCSGVQFYLLLSPYHCFISLLYRDLYVLGDDALIS